MRVNCGHFMLLLKEEREHGVVRRRAKLLQSAEWLRMAAAALRQGFDTASEKFRTKAS